MDDLLLEKTEKEILEENGHVINEDDQLKNVENEISGGVTSSDYQAATSNEEEQQNKDEEGTKEQDEEQDIQQDQEQDINQDEEQDEDQDKEHDKEPHKEHDKEPRKEEDIEQDRELDKDQRKKQDIEQRKEKHIEERTERDKKRDKADKKLFNLEDGEESTEPDKEKDKENEHQSKEQNQECGDDKEGGGGGGGENREPGEERDKEQDSKQYKEQEREQEKEQEKEQDSKLERGAGAGADGKVSEDNSEDAANSFAVVSLEEDLLRYMEKNEIWKDEINRIKEGSQVIMEEAPEEDRQLFEKREGYAEERGISKRIKLRVSGSKRSVKQTQQEFQQLFGRCRSVTRTLQVPSPNEHVYSKVSKLLKAINRQRCFVSIGPEVINITGNDEEIRVCLERLEMYGLKYEELKKEEKNISVGDQMCSSASKEQAQEGREKEKEEEKLEEEEEKEEEEAGESLKTEEDDDDKADDDDDDANDDDDFVTLETLEEDFLRYIEKNEKWNEELKRIKEEEKVNVEEVLKERGKLEEGKLEKEGNVEEERKVEEYNKVDDGKIQEEGKVEVEGKEGKVEAERKLDEKGPLSKTQLKISGLKRSVKHTQQELRQLFDRFRTDIRTLQVPCPNNQVYFKVSKLIKAINKQRCFVSTGPEVINITGNDEEIRVCLERLETYGLTYKEPKKAEEEKEAEEILHPDYNDLYENAESWNGKSDRYDSTTDSRLKRAFPVPIEKHLWKFVEKKRQSRIRDLEEGYRVIVNAHPTADITTVQIVLSCLEDTDIEVFDHAFEAFGQFLGVLGAEIQVVGVLAADSMAVLPLELLTHLQQATAEMDVVLDVIEIQRGGGGAGVVMGSIVGRNIENGDVQGSARLVAIGTQLALAEVQPVFRNVLQELKTLSENPAILDEMIRHGGAPPAISGSGFPGMEGSGFPRMNGLGVSSSYPSIGGVPPPLPEGIGSAAARDFMGMHSMTKDAVTRDTVVRDVTAKDDAVRDAAARAALTRAAVYKEAAKKASEKESVADKRSVVAKEVVAGETVAEATVAKKESSTKTNNGIISTDCKDPNPGSESGSSVEHDRADGRGRRKEERRVHWKREGSPETQRTLGTVDCSVCQKHHETQRPGSPCEHVICFSCLQSYLVDGDGNRKVSVDCPICGPADGHSTDGVISQPRDGQMLVTYDTAFRLPGFEATSRGTINIIYSFQSGIQQDDSPKPGKPFPGITKTAFLPLSSDGSACLDMLERAFAKRLIFKIDCTDRFPDGEITWNGILHKENIFGGHQNRGYPDNCYLRRLQQDLRTKKNPIE